MGIFSLMVNLGLNSTSFESGVKRSQSAIYGLESSVSSALKGKLAAAFSVAAVSAFAHSVVEAADHIGDLAEQMGITTDEVQKLQIVSSKTGIEISAMAQTFLKVGEFRKKIAENDASALQTARALGLDTKMLADMSNDNLTASVGISEAYKKTEQSARNQGDLVEIAGAKAVKVLSVLNEMHSLGHVNLISERDIKAISDFKDAMDESKRNLMVAGSPIMAYFSRALKRANKYDAENLDVGPRFDSMMDNPWRIIGDKIPIKSGFKPQWLKDLLPDDIEIPKKTSVMFDNPFNKIFGPDKFRMPFAGTSLTPNVLRALIDELGSNETPKPGESDFIGPMRGKAEAPNVDRRHRGVEAASLSGGSLRSIGGFFYDRFDDAQPIRQIVTFTEKTADATKQMADDMRSVRVNQ